MTTDRETARRRIPAYLLDLLEPGERARMEALLTEDASLREALDAVRDSARNVGGDDHPPEEAWNGLVRGDGRVAAPPLLEHLLACRDCRFTAAVVLAAAGDGAAAPRRPRRARTGLALAALVAAGLLGFGLGGRDATPVAGSTALLSLDAERGLAGEPSVALRGVDGVTLAVETVFAPASGRWQVLAGDRVRAEGTLAFPGTGPTLRTIAVFVPAARLEPGAHLLRLTSDDGSVDRQWRFTVR